MNILGIIATLVILGTMIAGGALKNHEANKEQA